MNYELPEKLKWEVIEVMKKKKALGSAELYDKLSNSNPEFKDHFAAFSIFLCRILQYEGWEGYGVKNEGTGDNPAYKLIDSEEIVS